MGELEQAVLDALWELDRQADGADAGGAHGVSGREVHARLHVRLEGRDLAYTTVMTVLDRLARKDLDATGADRDQALVSFVGEASAEDIAALKRALAELG